MEGQDGQYALCVITNSYNRLSLLKESASSLLKSLENLKLSAVIVYVDAGSTDGSIEFIQALQQETKGQQIVLLQETGISFSAGCNAAMRYSEQHYPQIKYALFYETDNFFLQYKPLEDALRLIAAEDSIATVGFTIEKFSGQKISYGSRRPTVMSFSLGQWITDKLNLEANKEKWIHMDTVDYTTCDIVYTSPLLVKTAVWQEVEGMDEKYFPFSDSDLDVCIKILNAGYQNVVIKCDGVVHDNKNNFSKWSDKRVVDFHKARFNLFRKYNKSSLLLLSRLLKLRHRVEIIAATLTKKDKSFVENRKDLIRKCYPL